MPLQGHNEVHPSQYRVEYPSDWDKMGYATARTGWGTPWPVQDWVPQARIGCSTSSQDKMNTLSQNKLANALTSTQQGTPTSIACYTPHMT